MTTVGQIEKETRTWAVALFQERPHYDYLGAGFVVSLLTPFGFK